VTVERLLAERVKEASAGGEGDGEENESGKNEGGGSD
jgi:hypothetical protein